MIYLLIAVILFLLEIGYFHLADRFNIIDKPNNRSSHSNITLRGGGVIFLFGIWIGAICFGGPYFWFLVGLSIIGLVSFIDDIHSLPDSVRLVAQFLAILLMFIDWDMYNHAWWLIVIGLVLSVGIINAYNFMDGINGMTGCYSLAVIFPLQYLNIREQFVGDWFLIVSIISLAVFLFFNFRKIAKCFAGDVGSVSMAFIIIFVLGCLIINTWDVTYIMFLAVYGVDSVLTIIHRIKLHENLGKAHRKHAYQLMSNELRMPHRLVSVIYAFLQVVISFGLIILEEYKWIYSVVVLLILTIGYISFIKKYYHLHEEYLKSKNPL